MDMRVERRVESCRTATKVTRMDPFIPSMPSEEPWQVVVVEHRVANKDGKHLLVLVDKHTR